MQRRLQMKGRPFTNTESLVMAVLDGQMDDEEYEHEAENESEGHIDSQVTELLLSAVNSVVFDNPASEDVVEQHLQPSTSSTERIEANSSRNSVPESTNSTSTVSTTLQSTSDNASDERRLKNVECKICMSEEVGVVFLPCGHLLSCVFCAPAISQCPLCRETIRGRVRTFLS
jgi:baculoviral IAP repeat-containing protein 2/3